MKYIIKTAIKSILIIIISLCLFFVFMNNFNYKVKTYQFNKNNKVVIFQEMVHFGDEEFYLKVNKKINNYKSKDYVYMYEMIKIEDKEQGKKMVDNLGLDNEIFNIISKTTMLKSQHDYMIINNKDVNADITAKQLNDNFISKNEKINNESIKIFIETFKNYNINNKISVSISRSILKTGLIINNFFNIQDQLINDLIIKERNAVLFDYVKNENKDIIIQYGQFHYNDFKDLMLKDGYVVKEIDQIVVF